ncbi:S-adenosyl-L-methionine-dependent methyltransferase [Sordaria brevicollis]|uniref:S-adenosyl-L-methionine-dependent methyltransferase n=1 Tax=Sordaria brevicollis TaxID=83679 RepID=A0AAE0P3W9_SORBR|nr:S-adenosyl-L-methionine-dependent methyltransferase [Sordaria brevicollis]
MAAFRPSPFRPTMPLRVSSQPQTLLKTPATRPKEEHAAGWSSLWNSDRSHFWDRGKPSPALQDLLSLYPEVVSTLPDGSGRRPRALVPGCGKGYDVVMLALHGYDTYGLDVSERAVGSARQYAASELRNPSAYNFRSTSTSNSSPGSASHGTATFLVGNFFEQEWEAHLAPEGEQKFDLIYDYTFLCALSPDMRRDWARRMSELLAPNGILVCLEFPLYKDPKLPGPPWGLKGVHWNLLAQGGDGLVSGDADSSTSEESTSETGLFERVLYLQPERTYEIGQGTDMLSVWKLR